MRKGKFGIAYNFYGVLAFIFALLGYVEASVILLGFLILAEKDEWAVRQSIQGLGLAIINRTFLRGVYQPAVLLRYMGGDYYYSMMGRMHNYMGSIFYGLLGVVYFVILVLFLVFTIMGIVKTAKGKEAGIPLLDRLANWAYGKVVVKVAPNFQQNGSYNYQNGRGQGMPNQGNPNYRGAMNGNPNSYMGNQGQPRPMNPNGQPVNPAYRMPNASQNQQGMNGQNVQQNSSAQPNQGGNPYNRPVQGVQGQPRQGQPTQGNQNQNQSSHWVKNPVNTQGQPQQSGNPSQNNTNSGDPKVVTESPSLQAEKKVNSDHVSSSNPEEKGN